MLSRGPGARYLLHDRDGGFASVATTVARMSIAKVRTAPRSPWQNAYVERVIGSVRRECLDHVIVVNETGPAPGAGALHRLLHALAKDSPVLREVHPPSIGRIVATPEVGGLHHRYERVAA
jgi:transposase InsO family protein